MSDVATQFQPAPLQPSSPTAAGTALPPTIATPRLRLWPGVLLAALMWAAIDGPGLIPDLQGTRIALDVMLDGALFGVIAIGLWWLFLSRAHWTDRLLILLFFVCSGGTALAIAHPSFKYMFYAPMVRGMPLASSSLILWLVVTRGLNWPIRRLGAVVAILLAWGYCCLLRFDGVTGDLQAQISWRWTQTQEERNEADIAGLTGSSKPSTAVKEGALRLQPGDWPSFRGAERDSRLTGYRIDKSLATKWKAEPPRKLWGHSIGPAWSSFAVIGDRIFTQEQRKKNFEAVVCYDANTGNQLWEHVDPGRFEEVAGGVGPRATPTFVDGKLYCLGANGKLNCLDAATGDVKWSRDIVQDSGAAVPRWGFSSSPLVAKGIVIVFAGGTDGHSLLGYKASSGDLAWAVGDGKVSYCSPHLEHLAGVDQVAIATEKGLMSIDPATGGVLWSYAWDIKEGTRVAQPIPLGGDDILLGTPMAGAHRVHIERKDDKWQDNKVWETKDIRPYFNDLVIYKGNAYGFDGSFFTCVNLEDGKGSWRARGYGNGQVVLLAEQGLLLISTERGEVALVEANPEKHNELSRFRALDATKGKTWNHPVLSHGKLFIRNDAEIACFEMPEDKGGEKAASSKQ
jgi:outer membrane protein assembly factor BamB